MSHFQPPPPTHPHTQDDGTTEPDPGPKRKRQTHIVLLASLRVRRRLPLDVLRGHSRLHDRQQRQRLTQQITPTTPILHNDDDDKDRKGVGVGCPRQGQCGDPEQGLAR